MKKILLFLSIALFLSAGVVTASKVQSLNANSTEMIVKASDLNSVSPVTGDDDKKKKAETKTTKDVKCSKENCKESCDKGAKCCDKGEASKEKCAGEAKKCCSKDKGNK